MKKRFWWGIVALTPVLAIVVYGQYEFPFYGHYKDFRSLPPQNKQNQDFTFVRLIYNGRIPGYFKNWYTDYPKGERRLIEVFTRLTGIDVAPESRALPIHHPDLFNYPFIYSVEGGQMVLDQEDAKRLREYLDRGGFWMIDDFWGSFEWRNFEREIRKVIPEFEIVDVRLDHPIFHSFFDIDELVQVPNSGYPYCHCPTWEQDGFTPAAKGIFDHEGRLLVFINHNTDLMDGSEWSDDPRYPEYFSAHSYRIFTNVLIYAMTH